MEIMAPGFYDCVKDSINNQFHIRNALKERGKQHFWIIINLESVAWIVDGWMDVDYKLFFFFSYPSMGKMFDFDYWLTEWG